MSRAALWALTLGLAAGWPTTTSLAAVQPPYRDAALSVEERLKDLLPRMTLEEKCAQLNLWPNLAELLEHKSIDDDIALTLQQIPHGVGAIEYDPKLSVEEFATFQNAVQHFLVEQTRLGIPAVFDGEACHGFVGNNATVFPGFVQRAGCGAIGLDGNGRKFRAPGRNRARGSRGGDGRVE